MNHTHLSAGTETIEMIDEDHMTGISEDDDDDAPSSPESAYADGEMMNTIDDDVQAQLAAAGPVGVAAAAAIASAKKRKRPHSFETNPSIRKRQQNRLLRKLRVSQIEEFFFFVSFISNFSFIFVLSPINSKQFTNLPHVWDNKRSF